MLFSEPKIPQYCAVLLYTLSRKVSVLFSEPKIPQYTCNPRSCTRRRVSVLFSEPKIPQFFCALCYACGYVFQCSSASRKFLNLPVSNTFYTSDKVSVLFSEPKIPQSRRGVDAGDARCWFQCSSASRKFLNRRVGAGVLPRLSRVSVLFSEPKIPQSRPSHLRPSIFPTATITLRHS